MCKHSATCSAPHIVALDLDLSVLQNLKDSDGADIWSSKKWYKIMLADGTELGVTDTSGGRTHCGPKPSGQGAVFRYRRRQGPDTDGDFGWPAGDIGYLKALITDPTTGQTDTRHMSLSTGAPPTLAFYTTDNSYGFTAQQAFGNRILLYGQDVNGAKVGLRVHQTGQAEDLETFGPLGSFVIALDCQLVPCCPSDDNWAF